MRTELIAHEINTIRKRETRNKDIKNHMKNNNSMVIESLGTSDLYTTIQSIICAAKELNQPPFDCSFKFVIKKPNAKEVTFISATIKANKS